MCTGERKTKFRALVTSESDGEKCHKERALAGLKLFA